MVSPTTDLAPASRNAREHASSVAPDVITSSSSKIRKLSTRPALADDKSATYGLPALLKMEQMLLRPRAFPLQQHGPIRQPQPPGQRPAKQVHLVEPTFFLASPVQWHGHHQIDAELLRLSVGDFHKPLREPQSQRLNPLEFLEHNRAGQGSAIDSVTPRGIEGKASLAALPAKRPRLGIGIRVRPWLAAAFADCRWGKFLERREASVADRQAIPPRQQRFAKTAPRWKEN